MDEVQAVVESLANRIGRQVLIDDPQLSLLAFSSDGRDIDEVRLASILQREAPPAVAAWLGTLRIQHAGSVVRVPANGELRMEGRICAPVRWEGLLLGYLWVIEGVEGMEQDEVDLCVVAAADIATAIYRRRLLDDEHRAIERQVVLDLLGEDPERRAAAATGLLTSVSGGPACTALVAQWRGAPVAGDHSHLLAGDAARERVRRMLPPRRLLFGHIDHHLVVLVLHAVDDAGSDGPAGVAARLRAELGALREGGAWRLGQGRQVAHLREAHRSHATAVVALEIVAQIAPAATFVAWDELGAWQLLHRVANGADGPRGIHPAIERLTAERDGDQLLHTLETYLDAAGDIGRASQLLFIHRGTLYSRLRRIERLGGIDLNDGDERLHVHMSVRLAASGASVPATRSDARAVA